MASDPSRIAFRQMMGVFAQYVKSQIVLKLRGAGTREGEEAVLARARASTQPVGVGTGTRAPRRTELVWVSREYKVPLTHRRCPRDYRMLKWLAHKARPKNLS